MASTERRKTQRLDLRASPDQVALIDAAASERGQDRTNFLLDAATKEAESVLADRTAVTLQPADWRRFNALLDDPGRVDPALRRLLRGE